MTRDKKRYRILVIEDNPGDFTIVEDLLSEKIAAPNIVHVKTFKQAAARLCTGEPPFDVILLDLSLPDKNGETLIAEMLRLAAASPVIILSGYSEIHFSIKSISLGILDYLLKDDLNAVTLYKSIIYAIERKKTISELKDSEKRYSDLFHLSPQPMWVFDPETLSFLQVNNAAVALYGYSEKEFLTMTLKDIKRKEDMPGVNEHLQLAGTRDKFFNQVVLHYKKSGEIIEVEIFSSPILINHKIYRLVVAHDITEKKLFEMTLIKAIIKTQEDERYEIGSELHDNICQILAAGRLTLGMLKNSLPPSEIALYDQSKNSINLALDEIRNLSHRLAPAFFDNGTLQEAFARLFDPFLLTPGSKVQIHFDDEVKQWPIPLDMQLNLYRIVQEQFRNILKYAGATLIEAKVFVCDNKLIMTVTDNGTGFDMNTVKRGIGIANMNRRAELFAGKFEVDSSPGNGCKVTIKIPLSGQPNHQPATLETGSK